MSTTVTITIDGKAHAVPAGITTIQASWHIGRPTIPGVGCLGGACGACPISYLLPNSFYNKTGLACQTLVLEGMSITFMPSDTSKKEIAPVPTDEPSGEPITGQSLLRYYRETRRCVACGACSTACPQGIDVMRGVRSAINGDLKEVAEQFTSCVACGLCAAVCGSGVRPHRVGLYARRLVGVYEKEDAQLLSRIEEIQSGQYTAEWDAAMRFAEKKCVKDAVNECV